ncbi:DNA-binding domain-containing protein [Limosilactobacillus agrestimuris]|uniref:DNA-binding domain-containing protein n=1 Tax=Limosilactobacillus agrestimuris TaxID=2941331 RepID=UPI00203F1A9B|nr:DNA-binding domain-containing protein [Limosilactobacillus agrestimuris]
MNFYIVDDDNNATSLLKDIIENDFNNSVVGTTFNPEQAFEDVIRLSIDVMFVNPSLSQINGIDLIKRIQQSNHHPHFIMVSQAFDPTGRTNAYKAGVDFCIEKPLNVAEVKTIIKLIGENISMSHRMLQILDLVSGAANHNTINVNFKSKEKENVKSIMRFLGITNGSGAQDITRIINVMIEQEVPFEQVSFHEIFRCDDHGKKIILQRIRRDLKTGLNNLAHMCLDYPENDIILEYANNLFEYKNVHNEMKIINGESKHGGQVSVKHFFNGLAQESVQN